MVSNIKTEKEISKTKPKTMGNFLKIVDGFFFVNFAIAAVYIGGADRYTVVPASESVSKFGGGAEEMVHPRV